MPSARRTVIDALIFELLLDSSKFKQGERDVIEALRKQGEKSESDHKKGQEATKATSSGLEILTKMLTSLNLTLAYAAVKTTEFFANMIKTNVETVIATRVLGVSTRELTLWQGMVEAAGGKAQEATNTLKSLQTEINRFPMTQESSISPVLYAFGVSMWTNKGELVTATELIKKLAQAREELKIDPKVAATLWESIGISPTIITLMLQGRMALEAYYGEQAKRHTKSPGALKAASDIWSMWKQLTFAARDLGTKFMTFFHPVFRSFTALFIDIMKMFNWMAKFTLPDWARHLLSARNVLSLIPGLGPFVSAFGGFFQRAPVGTSPGPGVTGEAAGATGGTVHGYPVEAYGPEWLRGQKLYDPFTADYLQGGVGGDSARFGPGMHEGVDAMMRVGTPTYSPFDEARVDHVSPDGDNWAITIEMLKDGKRTGIYAVYLHQRNYLVNPGDHLASHQQVGVSGYKNAAHTHFEMWHGKPRRAGSYLLNPRRIFGWGPKNLPRAGSERRALGPGDTAPSPAAQPPVVKPQSSLSLPDRATSFRPVPVNDGGAVNNSTSSETNIRTITIRASRENAYTIAQEMKAALETSFAA